MSPLVGVRKSMFRDPCLTIEGTTAAPTGNDYGLYRAIAAVVAAIWQDAVKIWRDPSRRALECCAGSHFWSMPDRRQQTPAPSPI